MITAKVSKMGKVRYLNVTSTNLKVGDMVYLKPKGIDIRVIRQVAKQGDRKILTIPKDYWEFFKHKSEVYVRK